MPATRRAALTGLATLLAAQGGARPAQAQSGPFIANTYGGRWEAFWRNQLSPRLQTLLGRPVRLDIGVGNGWVTNFRAAGAANPPFTSLMTNERFAVLLRNEGFFEKLPVAGMPNMANVIPTARTAGDMGVIGMISPIGIAYRTDMVRVPPKSWRELLSTRYRDQLGLYAIGNSASIMLLMHAGAMFGRGHDDLDAAIAKFVELKPFPQVGFSGQMVPLLTQGQVAIAPLDYGEVIPLKRRGVPIEIIQPEDGLMMFDQTFSIAANGPDKAAAAKYIDFMLSPEVQLLLAREFFVAPVNGTVAIPPDLADALPITQEALARTLRFDWALAARLASQINERWTRAI
ncbi:extracellular solute-binding protein [Falsiroseomonas tokyonensis]|uniref:Extracellular solute-binding protein n=1 Tax=Falsiroseomonas tokyonensis TaxID=430521 RepID=A0ABV7BY42_9PROT|nr:extracellular solute-binding protein [Falsiroseomonas tokyonensis]MBU8539388.1 extracellular solute-binding protein [Falsiroseomonas tokyonensis]